MQQHIISHHSRFHLLHHAHYPLAPTCAQDAPLYQNFHSPTSTIPLKEMPRQVEVRMLACIHIIVYQTQAYDYQPLKAKHKYNFTTYILRSQQSGSTNLHLNPPNPHNTTPYKPLAPKKHNPYIPPASVINKTPTPNLPHKTLFHPQTPHSCIPPPITTKETHSSNSLSKPNQ